MKRNETKDRVLHVLEINNHVPVKTAPICAVLGITPRELQQAVRDLRLEHVKVCSGDGGYWLWDGKDNSWAHTKFQIRSRMKKLSELYTAMDAVLDGQQTFDLDQKKRAWKDALMNL